MNTKPGIFRSYWDVIIVYTIAFALLWGIVEMITGMNG